MTTLELVANNLCSFGAHDSDGSGLLHAAHNDRLRVTGWCSCAVPGEEVYFRSPVTHFHGWMCATCKRITQTG